MAPRNLRRMPGSCQVIAKRISQEVSWQTWRSNDAAISNSPSLHICTELPHYNKVDTGLDFTPMMDQTGVGNVLGLRLRLNIAKINPTPTPIPTLSPTPAYSISCHKICHCQTRWDLRKEFFLEFCFLELLCSFGARLFGHRLTRERLLIQFNLNVSSSGRQEHNTTTNNKQQPSEICSWISPHMELRTSDLPFTRSTIFVCGVSNLSAKSAQIPRFRTVHSVSIPNFHLPDTCST